MYPGRFAHRPTRNGALAAAAVALILPLVGAPTSAMSLKPCAPNPLVGGDAVSVRFFVGGSLGMDDGTAVELFDGEREKDLVSRLTTLLQLQLEGAGYAVETDEDLWSTRDRARYEETGRPHYDLFVDVGGQVFQPPGGEEAVYAFVIEITFNAEFLTPEYENIETFSDRRLSMSTEADRESEIVALLSAMIAQALAPDDDFCEPEIKTTFSSGGRFSVDVIPPGAVDILGYLRGTLDDSPYLASLYAEPRADHPQPLAIFPLARKYPQHVLVSGDGRFVVMIAGLSPSGVLVDVYRADGSIVRSLELADLLSENDREALESITYPSWWQGEHAIDDRDGALILAIPACGPVWDCDRPWSKLAVDLETGQLLRSQRDLVYRLAPRVQLASPASPAVAYLSFVCRPGRSPDDFENARRLASEELLAGADLPMPAFTEIARKARIQGRVELELLLSEAGEVDCVAVTKGLPMGLSNAARDTALTWRFPADVLAAGPARGRLALRFELVVVAPWD